MGHTVTFCYCKNPGRPDKSPQLTPTPEEPMRSVPTLGEHRAELRENLRFYLAEQICVPGVTEDTLEVSPLAEKLTRAYRLFINELREAQLANDRDRATRQSFLVGDVLAELWQLAMRIPSGPTEFRLPKLPDAVWARHTENLESALDGELDQRSGAGVTRDAETDILADLLGQAFCRGHAELVASVRNGDPAIIMHHGSLVADLFEEMMGLTYQDWEGATEDKLPPGSPHADARSRRQAGNGRNEGHPD